MKQILTLFILLYTYNQSFSQGCVAVRGTGGMCMLSHLKQDSSKWQLTVNIRYFKSFRHFVGNDEQKQRVELGTQVINHSYTTDIALSHTLNNRWSWSVNVPIIANTRSSLYEHGGKERRETHSFGIGDARLSIYHLLFKPSPYTKGNIQLGLGIKLPTGDYRYQDYFYNTVSTGSKVLGPVDQSIQLGDGGTGFTVEMNAYRNFNHHWSVYGNLYYLLNPREQNGVSTARGATPSATAIAYGSDVMSVPDQYMLRAGMNYANKQWLYSLGLRHECVPVRDLIGGSNGFRRPGFITSVEPGISLIAPKTTFYLTAPVALLRNRTQSVPDKIRTQLTGIYAQGDAAFADFAINIGMSFKF